MSSNLLKPRAIKLNDKLGIIAMASAVKEQYLATGLSYIKSTGFKSKVALKPSAYYDSGKFLFCSDSPEKRVEAFTKLFSDKTVAGIISVRGGYGSVQTLPNFNFDIARRNPKVFVGFSDITALLINLYQKSGLVCIHGPSLITAASSIDKSKSTRQSVEVLKKLIQGLIVSPFEKSHLNKISGSRKEASGRLIGGNLCTLVSLVGTKWQAKLDNHILFLEETGEAPYRVHRMLLQLKLAGHLKNLRGVLLGEFSPVKEAKRGPSYEDVFKDIFQDYDFPVLTELPIGHGEKNFPIPLGIKARIIQNKLEILEPSVLK